MSFLVRDFLKSSKTALDEMKPVADIRRARSSDVEEITSIYNEAILTTTATFDTEPKTTEYRMEWFNHHDERHPIFVARIDGRVVGWASLTMWSDRAAYDDTAETSVYVKSEFRGKGIGRRLNSTLVEEAKELHYHTLIARIAEGSIESVRIHEGVGFVHIGTMKQVGRKFGKLLDVHIYQRMLEAT